MSNSIKYGNYFYGIETKKSFITAMSDIVTTGASGELILSYFRGENVIPSIILPHGEWLGVYAISMLDGDKVAVDSEIEKFRTRNIARQERERLTHKLRIEILERDGYKCCICGAGKDDGAILEVDHIVPVTKGGKTEKDNLQTLCHSCNHGKGTRIIVEDASKKSR